MIVRSIVATTHVDRQNERFAKEALESAAEQTNGDVAIPFLIEHDYTLPPCGKSLRAWVEATDDGQHKLVMESELFEEAYEEQKLPDGTAVFVQASQSDKRPIKTRVEPVNRLRIAYDPKNFESRVEVESFLRDLRSVAECETQEFGRKSLIPDPELLITLSTSLVSGLAAARVVDKVAARVGDQIAKDIVDFYSLVRQAMIGLAQYAIPKNRPCTYIFQIPGEPAVELIARTVNTDVDLVISAILGGSVLDLTSRAQDFRRSMGATYVQFLLSPEGKWQFNYLLTEIGGVIGTRASYSRRARRIQLMRRSADSLDGIEQGERDQ